MMSEIFDGADLVRRIDDDILAGLKARAKAHQRPAEAEVRMILAEVINPTVSDAPRRTLMSMVGSGSSSSSFKTEDQIVAHVRALRDEWDG